VGNWQVNLLRDALPRLGPGDRAILEHIDQQALLAPDPAVHSALASGLMVQGQPLRVSAPDPRTVVMTLPASDELDVRAQNGDTKPGTLEAQQRTA